MAISLSSLTEAIARLDEGLVRYNATVEDAQLRDGLILRFGFTYDLAHKMLRRVMEATAANPAEIDQLGFPDLIRTAFEQGLVASEWAAWRTWREMRNITSHTYDEAKALQVVAAIPGFLTEARDLLSRLSRIAGA